MSTQRAAALAVVVTVAIATVGPGTASARAVASRRRNNILFILTDDMALDDLGHMPDTTALLARHGATFDRYFVNSSVCCPSRATTLRGQYEHNTGVLSNGGANGGFEKAYASGIERDTIATHLSRAGYRTGLFGKYLNGYPNGAPETYVPPGWTDWASPVRGDAYGEYDYTLNENHTLRSYGHSAADYGTNVYMGLAERFIRDANRTGAPFFAYVSVYAPHEPATPAPGDEGSMAGTRVPRTPAFDQADVSAMPSFVRELPRLTPEVTAAVDGLEQRRLESLQAVDRGIAGLVETLRELHELSNTYVVFTSDNGFHLGQHRLPAGKLTAYDTDIHVPLVARGPGIPSGTHTGLLSGNVDLAPTFASMAHIQPPDFEDGRSLLAAARGTLTSARKRAWRRAYLIEHRAETGTTTPARTRAGALPLEPADPDQTSAAAALKDRSYMARHARIPDYDAVRTRRYLYVKYATGERELYDVRADPDEVVNLAGLASARATEKLLDSQLEHLRHCRTSACRSADSLTLHQLARRSA